MYDVKSKYKNPDKYIEKLKRDIEWQDERIDHLRKEQGEWWFCYKSGGTYSATLGLEAARRCRIKDRVALEGTITEIKAGCNKIDIVFSLDDVWLKPEETP